MKLFINAINLSSAGGLNVALNFLKGLESWKPNDLQVHVAAPQNCGYEALTEDFIYLYFLPENATSWFARLFIDYHWVPSLIKQLNPDVVFTMGNFATPVAHRQALLLQYPYPAYPDEYEIWNRLSLLDKVNVWVRNQVFSWRLHHADALLVQTETMRRRIKQVYPNLPSVGVLTNAYTTLSDQTDFVLPFVKDNRCRYLMCLTRYYPHKNLEVLVDVARLIRARGMPYRILLTIDAGQHWKARQLLRQIEQENLADILINIGPVAPSSVRSLHEQVDGLLLPTLLESFSSTYVDAMCFGLPIFTSRRDFAEEICGNCAYYFDPLSADDIVQTIDTGFQNQFLMARKIDQGRQRSATMPDWEAVTQMGLALLQDLLPTAPATVTTL